MKILFVCSRNKWRSRTAETVFKNNGLHQVKSAGTENNARIRLTQNLLNWADLIYVMERKHKEKVLDRFNMKRLNERIEILDIEDDYKYMDEELVEILKLKLNDIFSNG